MEQIAPGHQPVSSRANEQNLASTRQSENAGEELDGRIGSGLVDLVGGKARRA